MTTVAQLATRLASLPDDEWVEPYLHAICEAAESDSAAIFRKSEGKAWMVVAAQGRTTPPADPSTDALTEMLPSSGKLWLPDGTAAHDLAGLAALGGLRLALMEQREAAARQRQAADHFFSVVNHDLKGPLAGIKAIGDLILWRISRGKMDLATAEGLHDLQTRLENLGQRSAQMAELIDEIGELGAIERGQLGITPWPSDVATVVAAAVARFKTMNERAVTVETSGLHLPITVDSQRVVAILVTLLKNAAAYSEPDCAITVRMAEADGYALISVSDEGRGIPPEQQARLLKEYGRAIQQNATGLGIGLYVANALAEAHGGTLHLDSVLDQGTTATLRLPIVE